MAFSIATMTWASILYDSQTKHIYNDIDLKKDLRNQAQEKKSMRPF
jgi:hypothetical protein